MSELNNLDKLKDHLDNAITELAKVSDIWGNLSDEEFEMLNENYGLSINFEELVSELITWRSNIGE